MEKLLDLHRAGMMCPLKCVDTDIDSFIVCRTTPQQPSQHGDDQQDAGFASDDGRRVAARVAYSIAWFGFGRHSGTQHPQQLAQQLSQYDWQKLQQQQLYEAAAFQSVRPRRWKQPQRREWVDRVVSRARKHMGASSSSSSISHHVPASDNFWRAQRDHQLEIGAVRQAAGAMLAAQKGVQQCAEALHAASCSAACKAQATGAVLVTPLKQASQCVVSTSSMLLWVRCTKVQLLCCVPCKPVHSNNDFSHNLVVLLAIARLHPVPCKLLPVFAQGPVAAVFITTRPVWCLKLHTLPS